MDNNIEKTAVEYQKIDRKIKALQSKLKPLKTKLLEHANEHKEDFDEAFQLKFKNGTYISLRTKEKLIGEDKAMIKLIQFNKEFAQVGIDQSKVIEASKTDKALRKFLKVNNLSVEEKETLAVYAG